MKIYLIGFMGSGKTTVGKRLATHCEYAFMDTDKLFETKHNCTIESYFERFGEDLFRKEEALLLRETASLENTVIATGGGTPCFHDNMDWMLSHGICVYLEMSPKALYNRLINSKLVRPLLQVETHNCASLLEIIQDMLSQREQYYKKATITVSGLDVDISGLHALIRQGINASMC